MLARSMVSFVNFKDPKTITHPILVFATDLLWEKLAPWLGGVVGRFGASPWLAKTAVRGMAVLLMNLGLRAAEKRHPFTATQSPGLII